VIALVEAQSNSERLLVSAGVGSIARPNDASSVEHRLRDLLERHPIAVKPVSIDREPIAKFDRRRLTAKLAAVLDQAATGTAP
jgi:hypothetical protein